MKKLLTLVLFLAMSSLASATWDGGLEITVAPEEGDAYLWNGEDVMPSDIITVELISNTAISSGLLSTLMNISNGDGTSLEYLETGWLAGGGQIQDPPASMDGFDVLFNGSVFMAPYPIGWIYTVTFHVPDYKVPSDWIIIDAYSGTWNGTVAELGTEDDPTLPYAAIHVIPEPMTIALLGLGGLFLVRKRK